MATNLGRPVITRVYSYYYLSKFAQATQILFLSPRQTLVVLPGVLITTVAFYTVETPQLRPDRLLGLGITGTTGTVYRIESRSSMTSGSWLPLSTNTINTGGFNLLLPFPNATQQFYRAVWLPE